VLPPFFHNPLGLVLLAIVQYYIIAAPRARYFRRGNFLAMAAKLW
jgi:hypothetical protein